MPYKHVEDLGDELINRVFDSQKKNRHHILARNHDKEFDVEDRRNIVKIDEQVHNNLHRLFKTLDPQQQIRFMIEIEKGVLSREALHYLNEAITMTREKFYKKGLVL